MSAKIGQPIAEQPYVACTVCVAMHGIRLCTHQVISLPLSVVIS
jgi:hypothetical protein